ncbi:MAG TPA: hypothetical protein VHO69_16420, partial [Phototrophicaceae bacterium]|nr:hypothetical protein [Phototrophicaceae bacterium]
PIDLTKLDHLEFDIYKITVRAYDFNNDAQDEWLLYINRNEGEFEDYWLAQLDSTKSSGYRLSSLPIPYREQNSAPAQESFAGASLETIKDLNADGKLELVFSSWSRIPSTGYIGAYGYLYFLGWVDSGLDILPAKEMTNSDGSTEIRRVDVPEGNWKFEDTNRDDILDLVISRAAYDNWGCSSQYQSIYEWDRSYYLFNREENIPSPSLNCALRDAQEAMWKYDYQRAVTMYELVLQRYSRMSPDAIQESPNMTQFAAYAEERLVLAYALAGYLDQAISLLNKMNAQEVQKETIASAMIEAAQDGTDAFELCQAAYDFVEGYDQTEAGRVRDTYRGLPDLNGTDEQYEDRTIDIWFPWSNRTGCDFLNVKLEFLKQQVLPVDQPLLDQLNNLRITVTDNLHADLNNDGDDEWLIWIEGFYDGFLFTVQNGKYQFSKTNLWAHYPEARPKLHTLPGNSGRTWITSTGACLATCIDYAGETTTDSELREYMLWGLQNTELTVKQSIPVCGYPALEVLFPSPGQLTAWAELPDAPQCSFFVPATYSWDAKQELYILTHIQIPELTSVQKNELMKYAREIMEDELRNIRSLIFSERKFEVALDETSKPFVYADPDQKAELYYLRALALEALNHPDEALAEYVAIAEAVPGSAWAKLAALHFEPTP